MFELAYYFIKYCWYKIFGNFNSLGWRVGFSGGVAIRNASYISLGSRIYFHTNVDLQVLDKKSESNQKPKLIIKNFVTIGKGSYISVAKKVVIEDDVLIADFCYIADHQYAYKDITKSIRYQGFDLIAPVHIKKGVWIGSKVTICPGVTIGKNSVIGANSVVTRDVPDFAVAVGAPARVIKQYNLELKKWIELGGRTRTTRFKPLIIKYRKNNNSSIFPVTSPSLPIKLIKPI